MFLLLLLYICQSGDAPNFKKSAEIMKRKEEPGSAITAMCKSGSVIKIQRSYEVSRSPKSNSYEHYELITTNVLSRSINLNPLKIK